MGNMGNMDDMGDMEGMGDMMDDIIPDEISTEKLGCCKSSHTHIMEDLFLWLQISTVHHWKIKYVRLLFAFKLLLKKCTDVFTLLKTPLTKPGHHACGVYS